MCVFIHLYVHICTFVAGRGDFQTLLSKRSEEASSSAVMLTSLLCGTGCDLAEYFLRYVVSGIVLHDNVKAGLASRVS